MTRDIAIDGPSGCGKTSVGVLVAQALGLVFIDSGLLYRIVTAAYCEAFPSDRQVVSSHLLNILQGKITYGADDTLLFNGHVPALALHDPKVDAWVSPISAVPAVRTAINRELRGIAAGQDVVMAGRDIGTTVLPDALLKVFLTARAEVRARRRFHQLQREGVAADVQKILSNILERDRIDSSRADSPLHCTAAYLRLDNSADDVQVVVRAIIEEYTRRAGHVV